PPPIETELEGGSEHPIELRTIFLGGLLLLAMLAACYAAAEIVLPIVLAFVLNAVFRPVLRALEQIHLPRVVAALVIVLALVSLFVVLGLLLSGPIAGWIAELPQTLPRLQERLRFLSAPIGSVQRALENIQHLAPGAEQQPVAVQSVPLSERLLSETRIVAGGAFTTVLVLFFVLVSGEQFLRRLVEILP